jgi:hypothetical protein
MLIAITLNTLASTILPQLVDASLPQCSHLGLLSTFLLRRAALPHYQYRSKHEHSDTEPEESNHHGLNIEPKETLSSLMDHSSDTIR